MISFCLILAAYAVPSFAHTPLPPRPSEHLREFYGWYATTEPGAPVLVLGPFGLGEVERVDDDGRPWIVYEPWSMLELGRHRRRPFAANLRTPRGELAFDRIPGLRRARLTFENRRFTRQSRSFESTLGWYVLPPSPRAIGPRAAQLMTEHLTYPQNEASILVATVVKARELANLAQQRYDAHWRLERRFGLSNANDIHRRFRGLVPRDTWADLKLFEPPRPGWSAIEREDQLHLMNALRALARNVRVDVAVREAAEVEIPGLPFTLAKEQLKTSLRCELGLDQELPPVAPGDIWAGHVQHESLVKEPPTARD